MRRLFSAVIVIALFAFCRAPSAKADEWNKRTVLTVHETIQVPNKVLPPGTYVVKLLDSPSDRHIVQIFNAEETELITTILAIPNYRLEPTGKTVFTFWETPVGQPLALRAWFYPGDSYGQEFAYPKMKAVAIAAVAHQPVPSVEAEKPAEIAVAPVTTIAPPEKTEVSEAVPAPLVVPTEVAPIAPAPIAELPKTASPYPLLGLAGALALIAVLVVRVVRTS